MIPVELIQSRFPLFEKELVEEIATVGELRTIHDGDILMKTGQYIRSTMLVIDGLVKVYREDEEGDEFFIYYLQPGEACALSMICALKQETSGIMAKAAADTELIAIPLDVMDTWMMKYKS